MGEKKSNNKLTVLANVLKYDFLLIALCQVNLSNSKRLLTKKNYIKISRNCNVLKIFSLFSPILFLKYHFNLILISDSKIKLYNYSLCVGQSQKDSVFFLLFKSDSITKKHQGQLVDKEIDAFQK